MGAAGKGLEDFGPKGLRAISNVPAMDADQAGKGALDELAQIKELMRQLVEKPGLDVEAAGLED